MSIKPTLVAISLCAPSWLLAQEVGNVLCQEVRKVCVDDADRRINGQIIHRDCWRYEVTQRCMRPTDSATKNQCQSAQIRSSCDRLRQTCSQRQDPFGCLRMVYRLSCRRPIEGPGITLGAIHPRISWYERPLPSITSPCRIEKIFYSDTSLKDWPVANAPRISVSITPPSGWVKHIVVSCPNERLAPSCQTLIQKGCRYVGPTQCVSYDARGKCARYEATYVCDRQIAGDDIRQNPPVEKPTGDLVVDESECLARLEEAKNQGLTCQETAKKCIGTGQTITIDGITYENPCNLWEKTYSCQAQSQRACEVFESLTQRKLCRRIEKITCQKENELGECILAQGTFACVPPYTRENPPSSFVDFLSTQEADVMDDSDDVRPQGCQLEKVEKLDQGGWKIYQGRWAYRDLWTEKRTYLCANPDRLSCSSMEKDPKCTLTQTSCEAFAVDGSCDREKRVYTCTKPDEEIDMGEVCDGQVCIGNLCHPTDDPADDDFGHAAVQIELGRQLGLYADLQNNRFFSGETLLCKDRKGAPSCCRREVVPSMSNRGFSTFFLWGGVTAATETIRYLGSPYVYDLLAYSDKTEPLLNAMYGAGSNGVYNPSFSYWGVSVKSTSTGWEFEFSPESFALAAAMHFYETYRSCSVERQKLAMARGQGLCHYVGDRCDKQTGLGCLKREEIYVCFNSRLARIINEGGRRQLGLGWGTPEHPRPEGFTIEELHQIDFSQINLEEFIQEMLAEAIHGQENIGDIDLERKIRQRIERIIAGQRPHYRPIPKPNATTNSRTQANFPFEPPIQKPDFFNDPK